MDYETYANAVHDNLRNAGFNVVDDIEADRFDDVLAKRDFGLGVGILNTMVTVVDAKGMGSRDLDEYTGGFRDVLAKESYAKFKIGENMFGYIVFALANPDEDLIDRTLEYDVRERNTHVFPLICDLRSEEVHTHPVPEYKNRGLFAKQKRDVEDYLVVG